MVRAVTELNFISGDIQVIGAKLEKPESGIKAAVDANALVVTQEQPLDGGDFFEACQSLSNLAIQLFEPTKVASNGFAQKLYWAFSSAEAALKATLKLGDASQDKLSKEFGMTASHKHVEYHFKSGSYELGVTIQPVTFERVARTHFNAKFRSSEEQRRRIDRLNKRADRVEFGAAHALMLDLDLIEHEPPSGSLQKHYDWLMQLKKPADKIFKIE
ncbi:MAG: hypothetical protein ACREIF_10990 [Chthoniobacterales bacterium]